MSPATSWLPIALALLLTACASAPQRTVTITTSEGRSYETTAPKITDPRTHADGTRMDWVELATVKVHGALPAPKPMPIWSCYAADLGTTAVGLPMGFSEANPLGLVGAIPLGIASNIWARKAEKEGDPFAAKVSSIVHCSAAIWNVAMILLVL